MIIKNPRLHLSISCSLANIGAYEHNKRVKTEGKKIYVSEKSYERNGKTITRKHYYKNDTSKLIDQYHLYLFQALLKKMMQNIYAQSKIENTYLKSFDTSRQLTVLTNRMELKKMMKGKHYNTIYNWLNKLIDAGFILKKINHGPVNNFELILNPKYVFVFDFNNPNINTRNYNLQKSLDILKIQNIGNQFFNDTQQQDMSPRGDIYNKEKEQPLPVKQNEKQNIPCRNNNGVASQQNLYNNKMKPEHRKNVDISTNTTKKDITNNTENIVLRPQNLEKSRRQNLLNHKYNLAHALFAIFVKMLCPYKYIHEGEKNMTIQKIVNQWFNFDTLEKCDNFYQAYCWCISAAQRNLIKNKYIFYPSPSKYFDKSRRGTYEHNGKNITYMSFINVFADWHNKVYVKHRKNILEQNKLVRKQREYILGIIRKINNSADIKEKYNYYSQKISTFDPMVQEEFMGYFQQFNQAS